MLRTAVEGDVAAIVDVQERGSVLALASVFPQDRHPFPRDAVSERWAAEIASDDVGVLVLDDGGVLGFAASRGDEVLHLGVDPSRWGTGLAVDLHDALVATMPRGVLRLRVFEGNGRARRFYERLGWRASGEVSRSSFAPRPVLLHYELPGPRSSAPG